MFYKTLVHDQCPRFSDYEREKFARTFGEPGCLFKLGCIGPNTYADCSVRLWNSGTNFCINAGSPCIGCTTEAFARAADFPFYRKTELSG
jgi:hydrogenase small subunit